MASSSTWCDWPIDELRFSSAPQRTGCWSSTIKPIDFPYQPYLNIRYQMDWLTVSFIDVGVVIGCCISSRWRTAAIDVVWVNGAKTPTRSSTQDSQATESFVTQPTWILIVDAIRRQTVAMATYHLIDWVLDHKVKVGRLITRLLTFCYFFFKIFFSCRLSWLSFARVSCLSRNGKG